MGSDKYDDDWDGWSPEEEADIRRAMQDLRAGFSYTMVRGEDGKLNMKRCNKCQRIGGFVERPFPHKLNCPMR
jgi:hypothetical protein